MARRPAPSLTAPRGDVHKVLLSLLVVGGAFAYGWKQVPLLVDSLTPALPPQRVERTPPQTVETEQPPPAPGLATAAPPILPTATPAPVGAVRSSYVATEKPPPPVRAAPLRRPARLATFPTWYRGAKAMDEALSESRRAKAPLLLVSIATWCPYCQQLEEKILPSIASDLETAVKVRLEPEASEADMALAKQHGMKGYPTILFFANPTSRPIKLASGASREGPDLRELADAYREEFAAALSREAYTALTQERLDDTIAFADRLMAVKHDFHNGYGYYLRALAFHKKKEYAEALRDYQLGCAAGDDACCQFLKRDR